MSHAQIYQCVDDKGNATFKDTECSSSGIHIKPIGNPKDNSGDETPSNTFIKDDKPGQLIFADHRKLSPPYKIKIDEVRVITETDDTLVVDVIYTYEHETPADEVRIFVLPNHGYWSVNHIKASRGKNVGRASIGLSKSNMKKDYVTFSSTDTLRISFDHYPPGKYNGVIWSETVKYNKKWQLKR